MEETGKAWKPPEGKIMDDQMGLVTRAEMIDKSVKYITRFHWIALAVVMVLYFVWMIAAMFLYEGARGKGSILDPASFMFVVLLVIFTHSRIDALVTLLKAQGLLEAKPSGGGGEKEGEGEVDGDGEAKGRQGEGSSTG